MNYRRVLIAGLVLILTASSVSAGGGPRVSSTEIYSAPVVNEARVKKTVNLAISLLAKAEANIGSVVITRDRVKAVVLNRADLGRITNLIIGGGVANAGSISLKDSDISGGIVNIIDYGAGSSVNIAIGLGMGMRANFASIDVENSTLKRGVINVVSGLNSSKNILISFGSGHADLGSITIRNSWARGSVVDTKRLSRASNIHLALTMPWTKSISLLGSTYFYNGRAWKELFSHGDIYRSKSVTFGLVSSTKTTLGSVYLEGVSLGSTVVNSRKLWNTRNYNIAIAGPLIANAGSIYIEHSRLRGYVYQRAYLNGVVNRGINIASFSTTKVNSGSIMMEGGTRTRTTVGNIASMRGVSSTGLSIAMSWNTTNTGSIHIKSGSYTRDSLWNVANIRGSSNRGYSIVGWSINNMGSIYLERAKVASLVYNVATIRHSTNRAGGILGKGIANMGSVAIMKSRVRRHVYNIAHIERSTNKAYGILGSTRSNMGSVLIRDSVAGGRIINYVRITRSSNRAYWWGKANMGAIELRGAEGDEGSFYNYSRIHKSRQTVLLGTGNINSIVVK